MDISYKQPALKPQDLLVALKIAVHPERSFTYAQLAAELFMSVSEVHAAVKRAVFSRFIINSNSTLLAVSPTLKEFIIHGLKYVFPALNGPLTRGIPTGIAGPALRSQFVLSDDLVPVWPTPNGEIRGMSLYPFYKTIPLASQLDPKLYAILTAVDALRGGAAREREMAEVVVGDYLK